MDNVKDQRMGTSCTEFGSNDTFEGVDDECGSQRSSEPDYEKSFDDLLQSLSERYSPVGANYDDIIVSRSQLIPAVSESNLLPPDVKCDDCERKMFASSAVELSQLKKMEDEQELLVSSLIALASHFAQVQLRLRQIVEVPSHERDELLKDLESFAFRGVSHSKHSVSSSLENLSGEFKQKEMLNQRKIIDNLNAQLLKLENLASACSGVGLREEVVEQQKVVNKYKNELDFENNYGMQDFMKFSPVDLTNRVDNAIGEIMGPLKMKAQLVSQLKTQITDLERFIAYLQSDSNESVLNEKSCEAYNSYSAKKKRIAAIGKDSDQIVGEIGDTVTISINENDFHDLSEGENFNNRTFRLVNKASFLMQMFASKHLTGNTNSFEKNILKKTPKGNHWGDLRAQLEVDIQEIISLAVILGLDETCDQENRLKQIDVDYSILNFASSDRIYGGYRHGSESTEFIGEELCAIIRKKFSVTLQRLIQHGLWIETESATSLLMAPFLRCLHLTSSPTQHEMVRNTSSFSSNCELHDEDRFIFGSIFGSTRNRQMHAWELILQYYYLKDGEKYNNTPARKLSQSFNLDLSNSRKISSKDSLLCAINMIIALHKPYKRSYDAHFKAFICAALNSQRLMQWFDVIFSCNQLISKYYLPNSYVARTGFRDSLRSVDSLSKYRFNLPVDFAVKHFQNNK